MPKTSHGGTTGSEIVVLGSTGYVGTNLVDAFSRANWRCLPFTREEFDLTISEDYDRLLDYEEDATLINCAAMVDEDAAETDVSYRTEMYFINGIAPLQLRQYWKGYFVHICTPLFWSDSHYAQSKQIAHEGLRRLPGDTLIAMPGWLYGGRKSRNIDAILLDLRQTGEDAVIEHERQGNLTDITWAMDQLVSLVVHRRTGTALIYNRQRTTPWEFAERSNLLRPNWRKGRYPDPADRTMPPLQHQWFRNAIHITTDEYARI